MLFRNQNSFSSSSAKNAKTKPDKVTVARIKDMLKEHGIILSRKAAAAMLLTDSAPIALAQAWMDRFFSMVGDPAPNRDEIHLDAIHTVKTIYEEYLGNVHKLFPNFVSECVSLTAFNNIWRLAFGNVKLRVFKQVCLVDAVDLFVSDCVLYGFTLWHIGIIGQFKM
jgi:hypothetical protein